MAVNVKGHGLGHQFGSSGEGPDEQSPVLEPLVLVKGFAAFLQTSVVGRLDADKDGGESRLPHQGHQLLIISHVDGSFCEKIDPFFLSRRHS